MMTRRGFFASLAALVVAPLAAPPVNEALVEVAATARRLQAQSDRLKKLRRLGRPRIDLDQLAQYRRHVEAQLRAGVGVKASA